MVTMLRGIDISNHQGSNGLVLDYVLPNVDFVIAKATGGTWFVDKYCDRFVQACIKAGKPWGFYHFAGDTGSGTKAADEADFFIASCMDYFHQGIPILDWERDWITVSWVNQFVKRVHDRTGIWPWVYANPWRFNQGGVNENCGRWIASYPPVTHPSLNYDPGTLPKTDGLVCCWQYASDGRVKGYSGNLDLNHFYGDETAWKSYAGFKEVKQEQKETAKTVLENDEYKITVERK